MLPSRDVKVIFDKIFYTFHHTGDFRILISTNYIVYLLTKFVYHFMASRSAGYVLYIISLLHGCDRIVLSSDLLKSWGECGGHMRGLARQGWTGGGGGWGHRTDQCLC